MCETIFVIVLESTLFFIFSSRYCLVIPAVPFRSEEVLVSPVHGRGRPLLLIPH